MESSAPKNSTASLEPAPQTNILIFLGVGVLISVATEFFPPSLLFSLLRVGALCALGTALFLRIREATRLEGIRVLHEGEFQDIVRGFRDALIVYDQNFKILFANDAAEKLFGIPIESLVGRDIKPELSELPEFKLLVQVLFPSLAPVVISRSPGGTYPQVSDISFSDIPLELRVTTAQVSTEEDPTLGFVKVIQDRTREVSLVKMKEEFITVASHQLRTPVNELRWGLESLEAEAGLSEGGKAVLAKNVSSARSLSDLIENLLNISKIEEGRFGYSFVQTDLTVFLEGVLGTMLSVAERSGVKLYFDRPKEELPPVSIDPQKLSLVVANLIDNAIRYNVKQGQVTVSVSKSTSGPFLEVRVKDTGIGIPSEDIPKMFHKFFRAGNAVKFETEGSGLGLYIVRNILRAHGGDVWIESEVERGTTVLFTLPTDPTLIPPREVAVEY